jgi:hypothetical protein
MKERLAVISTKNPTDVLLQTIQSIQLYYSEFDIVIIDSDSSNLTIFEQITKECHIEYCKNKNWELGAWTYAFQKFPNYKVYMFLQDTLIPKCRIPNFSDSVYDNGTIYSFHYFGKVSDGGYFSELINIYKNTDLHFISELNPNTQITGGAHSSFILNKEDVPNILQLENAYIGKKLPKTKIDCWLSERTVGIMADKQKKRIDITPYFTKIYGGRDYI